MSDRLDYPEDLPRLFTERLQLRMSLAEEAESVLAYYSSNREYLRPFVPRRSDDFYEISYWQKQLEDNIECARAGQGVRLFLIKQDKIIGTANISNIVRGAAHFAYLGYDIDREHQGMGLMREALDALIEYSFSGLNLHRLMANYLPGNERSGRLLRRLGFIVEGYARDYLMIDGVWRDHIMTSLTNEAWCEN